MTRLLLVLSALFPSDNAKLKSGTSVWPGGPFGSEAGTRWGSLSVSSCLA